MPKKAARKVVRRKAAAGRKRSNPRVNDHMRGAVKMSTAVKALIYDNRYSSKPRSSYKHEFSAGVSMYGLRDGSVLLKGAKPLWDVFTVGDKE